MKRYKVIYKNFKKVWGYADLETKEIFIDKSINGKKHMEILIHEICHLQNPSASEEEVVRMSIYITNTLWQQKYRRIDDRNHLPLQDGTK
jgi:hypothetical protein